MGEAKRRQVERAAALAAGAAIAERLLAVPTKARETLADLRAVVAMIAPARLP